MISRKAIASLLAGLPRAFALVVLAAPLTATASPSPSQAKQDRPALTARVSRWQGDAVKKMKGPPGFDIQFKMVGPRFDGTFNIDGVPQAVPEGEPFTIDVRLTNVGTKSIRVSNLTVTGDNLTVDAQLLTRKVGGKSSATLASFKVPPQSTAGSSLLITVVLSNGDRHTATLTFSRPA